MCQTHLGRRIYPPPDWKNLDSVLASVLGPLFMDMERDAPFWQHIRRSEAVPTYGERFSVPEETVAVDLRRLLEPFQLGFRNLQEIWSLVLPPDRYSNFVKYIVWRRKNSGFRMNYGRASYTTSRWRTGFGPSPAIICCGR